MKTVITKRMEVVVGAALAALALSTGACQSTRSSSPTPVKQTAPAGAEIPADDEAPTGAVPAPTPEPAPTAIGMEDPFKRLNTSAMKTLDRAWKAARKRSYSEARGGFSAVVAAYPDKPAARFAELRMAVAGGDTAAVPALWKELLSRDYVGYARKLDSGAEAAPLRRSPEWPRIQAITSEMKQAYARGLDQGVFFVARLREAARPEFGPDLGDGAGSLSRLDLDQEAYHLDQKSGRIRRVSDSGGKVLAIHHDVDKRLLMFLLAGKLKKLDGQLSFDGASVAVLSLQTLEQVGPVPLVGQASSVDLCFSGKGEPLWVPAASGKGVPDPKAFTFEATGTSLVSTEEGCDTTLAVTIARPSGVSRLHPSPEGVALSEDGLELRGVDEEVPVRAGSPIRPGSFGWSPGKKRFVYMDGNELDRCQATELPGDESALYVWDSDKKRSQRVRRATSSSAEWLDDDRLAYEVGRGPIKRLAIQDLTPGGKTHTLETPAGAGLHGMPAIDCTTGEQHALVM